MSTRLQFSRDAKLEKRKALEALGINVHPYSFKKQHSVAQAIQHEGKDVTTSGRLMSIRQHGKVSFANLRDHTGTIQLMFRSNEVTPDYSILDHLDTGDFLGVTGHVEKTKTGEITVIVKTFTVLSKSLRPLPSTWQGIDDPETRYRKRYLDMILNPEVKKILDARWLIEKEIRRYLQDTEQFTEVETPILQPLYGGTNARPFTTHMNALDSDFYLRIAPELYLKRLIVAGYERVFEIARNFRNEGIDQTHQPEFTMMEWYEAYADYNRVMDVAEGLIRHLVQALHGGSTLKVGEHTVDVGKAWPRISMHDMMLEKLQIDIDTISDEQLQKELAKRNITLQGSYSKGKAVFALFDHTIPQTLIQPTLVFDYPKEISPLSKQHRSNPELAERFEGYIGGKEIFDGWSEITDALEQRSRFEVEQQHMREGDEEAQPTDEEFLEAMEYGMPPLGGIGLGIDRLVMFLTNTWSIKEVIAFPTLKPLTKMKTAEEISSQNIRPIYAGNTYSIDPLVKQDFPGISFSYVVISGVHISHINEKLEQAKKDLYESKKSLSLDDIEHVVPIQAYRKLFKATGTDVYKKRPSPEALLRRIATGKPLYTINTAVDAYNLSVIESGVGLGGFDLGSIKEPVVLRYSKQGEKMLLLGDEKETTLRNGQLVYADAEKPITIDVNYRDIDQTKITEKTADIILFADGAPEIPQKDVLAALKNGALYIQQFCGGTIGDIQTVQ